MSDTKLRLEVGHTDAGPITRPLDELDRDLITAWLQEQNEGEEVVLCEAHMSLRWWDSDVCEALAGALKPASPCKFVLSLVVPLDPKDGT